jgi:Bacterial regulatory proteins, gntR family
LVEKFEVSRSSVREALLALEKEGTIILNPFRGAIIKPLSPEEVLDIAELRLALISLASKPAYRHLSPVDFDQAHQTERIIIDRLTAAFDRQTDRCIEKGCDDIMVTLAFEAIFSRVLHGFVATPFSSSKRPLNSFRCCAKS